MKKHEALLVLGWIATVLALWLGMNFIGQMMEPKIIHHEEEDANCYTAGKMFFVSIACVPKEN